MNDFKYKVGMYGGSFDPLHIGHLNCMIEAASMCKELYIILSYSRERDFVPMEIRYRWILNSLKHIGNITIYAVKDTAKTKENYNASYWEDGAKEIKALIGKNIDVVFCGDDYKGSNRFESLYPESFVYYFDRNLMPVSSSMIRSNIFENWDYIPNICKSYFNKKILIIGGESTGKSTLTQNLALSFNTNFISEVGRETCEYAGGQEFMIFDDMIENLIKQEINMKEAIKTSNKVLFCDTDALTTLFYSRFLLKEGSPELEKCINLARDINEINNWDLVLFLEPSVEFIQDGTRNDEIAKDRIKYSNQIKSLFIESNIPFVIIDGNYRDRFINAKKQVEKFLKGEEVWD